MTPLVDSWAMMTVTRLRPTSLQTELLTRSLQRTASAEHQPVTDYRMIGVESESGQVVDRQEDQGQLLALLSLSNPANPSLEHKTFEKCWKKALPEGEVNIFDFVKPKIKTSRFSYRGATGDLRAYG